MPTVTMHQAKTNLSKLVAQAIGGEEVVITRGATPVARIVPLIAPSTRKRGALAGQIAIDAAFFDALPAEEIAAWGEG